MGVIDQLRKVKRNYEKTSRLNGVKKILKDKVESSLLFKEADVNRGFADRSIQSREIYIERIIQAYRKASNDQESMPAPYQVGNEWLPIYQERMGTIMQHLKDGNVQEVKKIYENFMREDCSYGLHGLPFDMHAAYFGKEINQLHKEIYLYDFVYRLQKWQEDTSSKYDFKDLSMPDFGNPYGLFAHAQFVRTGAEYMHFYVDKIKRLLGGKDERKLVMELGGGYGGLAYFINRDIPGVRYIDFDLPENMALAAFYLLNSFPEKKVLLYGEGELNADTMKQFDIILMPNFEISKLPTNSVDLAFNSYSLAEMSETTITTYIKEIMRASSKYIYHVNHTRITNSLGAEEFGISADLFNLVEKKFAGWNTGRFVDNDEYEFLYVKKANSSDQQY